MQLIAKSKGNLLSLDPNAIVGVGGEAKVFSLSQHPHLVAKVYHKPTKSHAKKLDIMLANPPGDPMANQGHISIAWPVDLLQSKNQEVVGFLMPSVKDMNSILNFYNPQIRHQKCPLVDYQYLHRTARNLATAVGALHKRGYVIGDLNESNILVSDTSRVTMVDTDSFQVTDPQSGQIYRCPVGKPEFTPPELQGVSFADIDRQPQHDLFGLSVLLFQLLMEGFHPFTGIYNGQGDPPPIEKRIAQGHFPYSKKWRIPYDPSPIAPDIDILHPDLKWLFFRCFEAGYKKPKRRPDADAWINALKKAEDALVECAQNEQHVYGKHLRSCPWCERAARLNGKDPFPSVLAIQQGKHLQKQSRQTGPSPIQPSSSSASTPFVSVSQTSVSRSNPGKSSKKYLVVLLLLLSGIWATAKTDIKISEIALPKLPKFSWPDLPDFARGKNSEPSQAHTPGIAKPGQTDTPSDNSQHTLATAKSLETRFRELDNPNIPVPQREHLYQKFLDDYRYHPGAGYYLRQAEDQWEQMSFEEIVKSYRKFQLMPHATQASKVLKDAEHYLDKHTKRNAIATDAMRFAQWHLSSDNHPLTLYIDQQKELYVKVIYQGNVYAETKGSGRFTAISLPRYKPTDPVRIEGYQDDRFDDTNLGKAISISSLKGNHHHQIADQRGNIIIQAIYKDFPGAPQF